MYDKKKHPSSLLEGRRAIISLLSRYHLHSPMQRCINISGKKQPLNDCFHASARLRRLPASSTLILFFNQDDFFSRLFGVFFTNLTYELSTSCPLSGCDRRSLLVPTKPLRYAIVQLRLR